MFSGIGHVALCAMFQFNVYSPSAHIGKWWKYWTLALKQGFGSKRPHWGLLFWQKGIVQYFWVYFILMCLLAPLLMYELVVELILRLDGLLVLGDWICLGKILLSGQMCIFFWSGENLYKIQLLQYSNMTCLFWPFISCVLLGLLWAQPWRFL